MNRGHYAATHSPGSHSTRNSSIIIFPLVKKFPSGNMKNVWSVLRLKANNTRSCFVVHTVNVNLCSCIPAIDWRAHTCDQMTIHVNICLRPRQLKRNTSIPNVKSANERIATHVGLKQFLLMNDNIHCRCCSLSQTGSHTRSASYHNRLTKSNPLNI